MAYTIQDIHNRVLFLIDKEQNGFATHGEIDTALDIAQMRHLHFLYGNPVQYQPGAPVPQVSLGVTQSVNDSLSPFIKKYTFTNVNTASGVVSCQTDHVKTISLAALVYNNDTLTTDRIDVEPVTEEELATRLSSYILTPSATKPIYVQRAGNLQVYPASAFAGELIYLKRPAKPVFAYTQTGRAISYNSGSSTTLEWRDDDVEKIIILACEVLGFKLNDPLTIQFTDKKSKEA